MQRDAQTKDPSHSRQSNTLLLPGQQQQNGSDLAVKNLNPPGMGLPRATVVERPAPGKAGLTRPAS